MVFIVDRASYIGSSSPPNDLSRNWNLIKTFLNTLAGRMRFGATNTQLATLTFGKYHVHYARQPNVNYHQDAVLEMLEV